MKSLRLTFNKPTVDHFFAGVGAEGQQAEAIAIKIEDGVVYFLPMAERSKETLPLDYRTRGGAEANAEGTQVGKLIAVVQNAIGPFFTLQRVRDGWLKAVPHTKPTAPQKFADHVRFWMPKDSPQPIMARASVATQADGLPAYLGMVRAAFALAASYDEGKKPGRPPREILEARDIVAEFRRLALLVDVERTETLRHAHELIGKLLSVPPGRPQTVEEDAPAPAPKPAEPPNVHHIKPQAAKAAASPALKAKSRQGEDRGFNHGPVEVSEAQIAAVAARLGAPPRAPAQQPAKRGQVVIRDQFNRPHRRQHVS